MKSYRFVLGWLQRPIALAALLACTAALVAPLESRAQAQGLSMEPDKWVFSITPYLWLPNINGTLNYGLPTGVSATPSVEIGADQYFSDLKMAALIAGEARKDRWSIFTDVMYMNFGSEQSAVKSIDFVSIGRDRVSSSLNEGTSSSLKAAVWTLGGSYSLLKDHPGALEGLAGFRYLGFSTSTDWNLTASVISPDGSRSFPRSGNVSERVDLWDAIVGLRGNIPFGESNWSLTYYADLGAGTESSSTYQWLVGINYAFRWGGLILVYRELYYDQSGDRLIQNMRFSGPALGVTFRF